METTLTPTSQLKVLHTNTAMQQAWHRFLNENDGSYLQTLVWKESSDSLSKLLIILNNNEIVAGCQYRIINYPLIGKIGYIYQGPCYGHHHADTLDLLASEIKNLIALNRLRFMVVAPDLHQNGFIPYLHKHGFKRKPSNIPPSPAVKSTLVIDLTPPIEEIYKNIKKSRRNSIKKSLASPIRFELGNESHLPTFYRLMLDTCARRGSKPVVASLAKLEQLWTALASQNWVVMHLTIVEQEIVCASMGVTFGKTYRNWYWGWNGKYANYNATDGTDWHTIQWAKENGFKYYDFVHIDPISAEAILSSVPVPDSIKARDHYGSTFYKMQFGGNIAHYPPAQCSYSNPFFCFLIQTIGTKLFELGQTKLMVRWGYKLYKKIRSQT